VTADIDALADTIRACFTRAQSLGPTDMSDGHRSLEGLVATAKAAEARVAAVREAIADLYESGSDPAVLRVIEAALASAEGIGDGVGALTERPVADAMSSTSGGIPAQVGTGRSVNAPDIDALADTVREGFSYVLQASDGPFIKVGVGAENGPAVALSSLVAIAKAHGEAVERAEQAGRQIAVIKTHLDARCEHLVERAERAERERDEARAEERRWYECFHAEMVRADGLGRVMVNFHDIEKRAEAAEARVAELEGALAETMVVIAESDRRAILIALDELEAYVSVIGDEDEAHERQVWAVKKLRILVQSLDAQ